MPDDDVVELDEFAANLKSIVNRVPRVRIRGMIGRVTRASSGHTYFEASGSIGRVQCCVWASSNLMVQPGFAILSVSKVDFYPPHGRLSIVVSSVEYDRDVMSPTGKECTLAALHAEGLVGRPRLVVPDIVTHLCILTSIGSAAYHDVMHSVGERWPGLRVTVIDTLVQGEDAPASLTVALSRAAALKPSVIVCARGGGSESDLAAFNEECVARAMCNQTVPVVNAIGHESDHSVCDAVADVRAKTPTAAIEIVIAKTRQERVKELCAIAKALDDAMQHHMQRTARVQSACRRSLESALCATTRHGKDALTNLNSILVERMRSKFDHHTARLKQCVSLCDAHTKSILHRHELWTSNNMRLLRSLPDTVDARCKNRLERLRVDLTAASPYTMLDRGLALVRRNKRRIESSADLHDGDQIEILFADGKMAAVQTMIQQLQTSDDVDEALALYEKANAIIRECDQQIQAAKGKFEELSRHTLTTED